MLSSSLDSTLLFAPFFLLEICIQIFSASCILKLYFYLHPLFVNKIIYVVHEKSYFELMSQHNYISLLSFISA